MLEAYQNLMYMADFYKVSHKPQYEPGIAHVHSTLTARGIHYNNEIDQYNFKWFGYSLYLVKLKRFSDWFFSLSRSELVLVLLEYKTFLDIRLNSNNDVSHWEKLYDLQHIPLTIHAAEENSIQELQTPLLTVDNTNPDFFWLTSFIETSLLSNVWGVTTAANRAWNIRIVIENHMLGYTDEERAAIDFMCHDFSYRGLPGDEAASIVGCGHLSTFKGSDTIPAIVNMEKVYGEITGFSVPATEHSVMCAGGKVGEFGTVDRILDIYPTGILSCVWDTWDYYAGLKEFLPKLKDKIMARDGKFVIRPDSGDPVKIVCGGDGYESTLEILDEIFGHTLDSAGLKVLDSHIGIIYGDGMNQTRIDLMLTTMIEKGYSPLNIVFGVGAYTYQLMTRDELGLAFKATAVCKDDKWIDIMKDPKTDGKKKSLTGRFTPETHPMLKLVYPR